MAREQADINFLDLAADAKGQGPRRALGRRLPAMIVELLDAAGVEARHASATVELGEDEGGGTGWAVAAGLLDEGKAVELSHRMGPAELLAFGELGPPARQGMTLKIRVLRRSDASLALRMEKDFFEEEVTEIAMTVARALAELLPGQPALDAVDAASVLGSSSPEALLRLQEGLDCLAAASGQVKGGDVTRAIELLLSALEEDPASRRARESTLLAIATRADDTLGLEVATTQGRRLVELTAQSTDAVLLLSRLYRRQGKPEPARTLLVAALDGKPESRESTALTAELVTVLNQLDELDEAIERGQAGLELDSGGEAQLEATLSEQVGIALARKGRLTAACAALQRAVELDPGRPKAWANLGRCQLLMGDGAAQAALERSLELETDSWEVTWSLVEIAIEQSELETAATLLRPWPDKRPADPIPALTLAELLIAAAHLDESRTVLAAAVERFPADPRFRALLGGIATQLGELAGAEIEYRKALKLAPDEPGFLSNLAVVLSQLGNLPEAEELAQHAVELDPADQVSQKVLEHIRSKN